MQWLGWRAAFAVPGLACLALGVVFMASCRKETESPAKRKGGARCALSPLAGRARAGGDDARLRHRRHPVQSHHQRQRAAAAPSASAA